MVRLLLLMGALSVSLATASMASARAATWTQEQTNSGTSSFMAEELRGCNQEPRSWMRERCRAWTRHQLSNDSDYDWRYRRRHHDYDWR